jgi:hypothetical protein
VRGGTSKGSIRFVVAARTVSGTGTGRCSGVEHHEHARIAALGANALDVGGVEAAHGTGVNDRKAGRQMVCKGWRFEGVVRTARCVAEKRTGLV